MLKIVFSTPLGIVSVLLVVFVAVIGYVLYQMIGPVSVNFVLTVAWSGGLIGYIVGRYHAVR